MTLGTAIAASDNYGFVSYERRPLPYRYFRLCLSALEGSVLSSRAATEAGDNLFYRRSFAGLAFASSAFWIDAYRYFSCHVVIPSFSLNAAKRFNPTIQGWFAICPRRP